MHPYLLPALVVCALPSELERDLASVPAFASSAEQWQHALSVAARIREARAVAQPAARRAAAAAWVAVRARFPLERALAAEAAFRAAEQLRILEEDLAALRELEFVRAESPDPTLRAKASLEAAHIERRRRNGERALDLYLALSADSTAPPRRRDEAALWVGKTYAQLGRFSDAERWLRRASERAGHALDRVRAFDEWCALYVGIDDLEAAAGVLATCRASLAPLLAEETRLGEAVREALDSMRSIPLLERAVARRRARADAHPEPIRR
jgi:tetratricopeptide (TPR) repeat protein